MASSLTTAASLLGSRPEAANRYRDRLARAYAAQGRWDEALVVRRQMVREMADDPDAHVTLAILLEQKGDWTEAAGEYQSAIRLGPRMWWTHAAAGNAYARHGLFQDAVAAYQAAIGLAPERADLRGRLNALTTRPAGA
jgi:pentatricopeptide repeat protein